MAKKKLIEKKVVILQRYSDSRGYTYKEFDANLFERNKEAILKDGYCVLKEKEAPTEVILNEVINEPLKLDNNEPTL